MNIIKKAYYELKGGKCVQCSTHLDTVNYFCSLCKKPICYDCKGTNMTIIDRDITIGEHRPSNTCMPCWDFLYKEMMMNKKKSE